MTTQEEHLNTEFCAVDLRADHLPDGNWIGNAVPQLSWKLQGRPGTMQKSYRIQAASSPERLDAPDLWDSGTVYSEQSIGILWEGKVLESRQRVYWRVILTDQNDVRSAPSANAGFEISLLKNSDWEARWIYSGSGNPACSSPCPYFRREFDLSKTVKRAVLYVTARGLFEVRINGRRVGDDHFTPGWTDFKQQIQFLTYDVTPYLHHGRNAAGAILGDGWYCGYLSGRRRNLYGEKTQLLFQMEIEYQDGSFEKVLSGKNWKCTTGPILASDIYDGEQYDARLEMDGWDHAGFDEGAWHPVRLGEFAVKSPQLVQKSCPPVRRIMELKPVRILNPRKDVYIWDFGQNITGRMRVRLRGHAGALFSFQFAEMLNPDGTLYTLNYRGAKSIDYYTCRGMDGGFEQWEPLFTFHGFRYLQINGFQYVNKGCAEEIEATAIVMHSDLELTGTFSCGNKKVNRLYQNVCWGQRDNFLEIPTDCPQRDERLGWTGDANVFAATAAFNMNVVSFFRKWLRDLREAQRADGAVPCVVPNVFAWGFGAAAWADAAVRIPWIMYQRYGDLMLLKECYGSMKKWVDYQRKTAQNGIRPKTHFADWLAPSAVETPSELIGTAFFAETAGIVGRTAALLNKEKEAVYYSRLAKRIKSAFRKNFVGSDGLLKVRSQTACVLALQFELLTPPQTKKNAALLVKLIRENGGRLSTGFVGTAWITQALSKSGYPETACDLLLQEEYPSWLYSVNQGATTIWERWNSYSVKDGFGDAKMNSFNHYAYGAVAEWMTSFAGGIRFDESAPGGRVLIFAAEPDPRLKYVSCTLETPYGTASSSWKFTGKQWKWEINAPCNTRIKVVLPQMDADVITLDRKTVSTKEIFLENGKYQITANLH